MRPRAGETDGAPIHVSRPFAACRGLFAARSRARPFGERALSPLCNSTGALSGSTQRVETGKPQGVPSWSPQSTARPAAATTRGAMADHRRGTSHSPTCHGPYRLACLSALGLAVAAPSRLHRQQPEKADHLNARRAVWRGWRDHYRRVVLSLDKRRQRRGSVTRRALAIEIAIGQ